MSEIVEEVAPSRPTSRVPWAAILLSAVLTGALVAGGFFALASGKASTDDPAAVAQVDPAQVTAMLDAMDDASTPEALWMKALELQALGRDAARPLLDGIAGHAPMTQVAGYRVAHALMHTREAEDGLVAILRNEAMPAAVRESAALVISQVGSLRLEPRLLEALEHTTDDAVKIPICLALWERCSETRQSLRTLRQLMQSDDAETRIQAAMAYASTEHWEAPTIDILDTVASEGGLRGQAARQLLQLHRLGRTYDRLVMENPGETADGDGPTADPAVNTSIIEEVIQRVQEAFIDEEATGIDLLARAAAEGMLRDLDSYNAFIPDTDRVGLFTEDRIDYNVPGTGLIVGSDRGLPRVIGTLPGSSADAAGLRPWDAILNIDGNNAMEMGMVDIVSALHGEVGGAVDVEIMREGWTVRRTYSLSFTDVAPPPIHAARIEGGLAVVELPSLAQGTAAEVRRLLGNGLLGEGVHGLILDLRHCPGGRLDEALALADLFLPPETLVVYSEGHNPAVAARQDYTTTSASRREQDGLARYPELPLAVLIGRGTADAAEILTGGLQAHGRASIIGAETQSARMLLAPEPEIPDGEEEPLGVTFGKAMLQRLIPLNYRRGEGAPNFPHPALRLTVAHYYLPDGTRIQERGIVPDERITLTDRPDWVLDEISARSFRTGLATLVTGLVDADSLDTTQPLATFDRRDPEAWAGLQRLIQDTGCMATPEMVRQEVRAAVRVALTGTQGSAWRFDLQDDRVLFDAAWTLLERADATPSEVELYRQIRALNE